MSPLSFVGPTAGLVASFNRPGGNLTGVTVITNTLWPKRIELLRELLPTTPLIAVLVNPTNLAHLSATRELSDVARKLGQELLILPASVEADFETTFRTMHCSPTDATFLLHL